jgi:hypothetical protein
MQPETYLLLLALALLVGCSSSETEDDRAHQDRDAVGDLADLADTPVEEETADVSGDDSVRDTPDDITMDDVAMDDVTVDEPAQDCGDSGPCEGSEACIDGICRDACIGGTQCWDGLVCFNGFCVDCIDDQDCADGNMVCNQQDHTCEETAVGSGNIVGAMYHQWWTPSRWESNRGNYVYEPVLGHYDNSDPDVVARHHDWAQRGGVNTWVMDTWITERDWWWVEPNSMAVMDEADRRGMKYFLLIDGWFEFQGGDDGFDANTIAAMINRRFATWFTRPGYLRVDGRPVVFFWGAWGKSCSVFERIRSGIEGTLGPIYLTGNNGDTSCWDRVMMYNPYTNLESTHAGQLRRQRHLWGNMEDDRHPWAPTAMPGYDDTHVRDGNPPIALDPDFFRQSIRTALSYDQRADPWLFVCSWSEWHEGSNIEPSSDFDSPEIFLDVLHEELVEAGWR